MVDASNMSLVNENIFDGQNRNKGLADATERHS